VAYTRNATGTLRQAVFLISLGAFGPSGPTNVRGTDTFGNQYVADASRITVFHEDLVVAQDMPASGTFPPTVRYLGQDFSDPYTIAWEMSGDGGLTWYPAGQSDNRLFLLLGNPAGPYSALYETVGWLSCRNADGATDANAVIEGSALAMRRTRDGLGRPETHRKPVNGFNVPDDLRLGYWLTDSPNQNVYDMLKDEAPPKGDGSCVAWAQFLIACGNVHGVSSDLLEVTASTIVNPGATGFLVQHWDFRTPSGSGYYPYEMGSDVVDQTGIAGQYNSDPPGEFYNHYVVGYGGNIHDPSYGTGPFGSEGEHEEAAIDGIRGPSGWARKQVPGVVELIWSP
jgi:hypothetical protein